MTLQPEVPPMTNDNPAEAPILPSAGDGLGAGAESAVAAVPIDNDPRPPFDYDALMEKVRGKTALLHRIAKQFLIEYGELLGDVTQALFGDDHNALERSAHKFAGTLLTMCAESAAEPARKIENMARAGDLSGVDDAYSLLVGRVDRLQAALNKLLAEAGA